MRDAASISPRATHEPSEKIEVRIDGRSLEARAGATLLSAALEGGIYIPHLCYHPDLPPSRQAKPVAVVYRAGERIENDPGAAETGYEGCGLCVVEVEGAGEPRPACDLLVSPGLAVRTEAPALQTLRRQRLARIFATHPHACVTCAQKEGCSREPCSTSVPQAERCCVLLGRCELERVASHVGLPPETRRYVPRGLPAMREDPLFAWEPELCVGCLRCVRACRDLKGVEALGFVYSGGEPVVGLVAPDRASAACRYCGACVDVCPTGALLDRIGATVDESKLVPCRSGCPAGMDVPRFLRAASQSRVEEAAGIALDRLPLPNVLSRVCFHPCERDCRRSELGGALSVCRVRRQVFETAGTMASPWPVVPEKDGRVAVIGSGPAGLAAAHFLRRLGHGVTVFDAAPEPGGMLRYGIPAYRLPREVLARDIELLAGEGIELRLGKALGRDLTLAGLRDAGFAAVLLAVGAGAPKPLPVDGANLNGVHLGVDFLREAASGSVPAGRFAGQAVAVIGGGNVAVDAARTARRLGASQVTLACLEAADEMPAYPEEIKAAAAEGVRILDSWGVGEILGSDGSVRGLRLVRCASVFDEAGRFAPKLDQGTSREIEANAVIIAIGQAVERGFAEGCDPGFEFRSDGFLAVSPEEMEAGAPGVFACGDLCLGPSSVVQSIASGRKAAESIDRFLGGSGEIASILGAEEPEQRLGRDEGFAARARAVVSEVPPAERIGGFSEVELTLEACAARIEAGRCLQCDLRLLLSEPTPPPVLWLELTEEALSKVPDVEGVYQLLGDDRSVMRIAGAPNLREALERELARDPRPPYFVFQEDPMFTKRESELIQQFLAQHGHMPEGDGEMDDLF